MPCNPPASHEFALFTGPLLCGAIKQVTRIKIVIYTQVFRNARPKSIRTFFPFASLTTMKCNTCARRAPARTCLYLCACVSVLALSEIQGPQGVIGFSVMRRCPVTTTS